MVKQKLLFVITKSDSIGGAQIYVLNLAESFKNDGFEVAIAAGGNGAFADLVRAKDISYITLKKIENTLNILKLPSAVLELNSVINKYNPDLVSLNSSMVGLVGRISCYLTKTFNVFTVHGWSYTDGISPFKAAIFNYIEKGLKTIYTSWILVSKYDYNLGITNNTLISERAEVIYNGFILNNNECSQIQLDDKLVNIVMVARHDNQKDHKTLFNALKALDGYKLYLIGDGPLLQANVIYVKEIGIFKNVEFLGYKNDVLDYVKKSDIFVLSSNWEGFPISTIEAMGCGVPVIVSGVGGAGEAVEEGVSGYVIKRKDSSLMSKRINSLILNKKLRGYMGVSAEKRANKLFTLELMYEKTKRFYLSIIEKL